MNTSKAPEPLDKFTDEDLEAVRKWRQVLKVNPAMQKDPEVIDWMIRMADKYTGDAISKASEQLRS